MHEPPTDFNLLARLGLHLDDSEAKRLLQCNIREDAPGGEGQKVDVGDV